MVFHSDCRFGPASKASRCSSLLCSDGSTVTSTGTPASLTAINSAAAMIVSSGRSNVTRNPPSAKVLTLFTMAEKVMGSVNPPTPSTVPPCPHRQYVLATSSHRSADVGCRTSDMSTADDPATACERSRARPQPVAPGHGVPWRPCALLRRGVSLYFIPRFLLADFPPPDSLVHQRQPFATGQRQSA